MQFYQQNNLTLDQMSAAALDDTFLLDNTNIIGTYMIHKKNLFHLTNLFLIAQFKYMALVQFLES